MCLPNAAQTMPRARPDIGPDIDMTRPVIPNAQGQPQTERSETVRADDGKWYNRSTVGEPIWTGGPFASEKEAVKSAKLRSKVIGQVRKGR